MEEKLGLVRSQRNNGGENKGAKFENTGIDYWFHWIHYELILDDIFNVTQLSLLSETEEENDKNLSGTTLTIELNSK